MKIFGPDDNDGLRLLNPYLKIRFVTGDRKGLPITNKRIKEDMKFDLDLVSTIKRIEWIKEHYNPKEVIYMGDGIFDHYVMKEVGYSIAPANSDKIAKAHANYEQKDLEEIEQWLKPVFILCGSSLQHMNLIICPLINWILVNGKYNTSTALRKL